MRNSVRRLSAPRCGGRGRSYCPRRAVARLAQAETLHEAQHTTAVLYGYFPGLIPDGYHWWYRPGVGAGAIPTNGGRHCVFVATRRSTCAASHRPAARRCSRRCCRRQTHPLLLRWPSASGRTQPLSVFAGRKGFMRQACGPGWALVGDAGYFKDPLTAHGITDALRDAELLANAAVGRTTGRNYAATRDALSLPLFEVTDAIAALDWDLEQLKALHQTLNQAMKREVEHLSALRNRHIQRNHHRGGSGMRH